MRITRRGYLPDYEKMFRNEGIAALQEAVTDALFLLNRGHNLKRAAHFAMEHYQLSNAQRIAMTRGIASDDEILRRSASMLPYDEVKNQTVFLDGFNAIILMESLVSASPVFLCMDGAVRDLANLKGSYRIIDKTELAIRLILQELDELHVSKAVIHIDSPVSNSRNLKLLILKLAEDYTVQVEVYLINACDKSFYQQQFVISGDGIVMDNAQSWIPLYRWIVEKYRKNHETWIVDFNILAKSYRRMVTSNAPQNIR